MSQCTHKKGKVLNSTVFFNVFYLETFDWVKGF